MRTVLEAFIRNDICCSTMQAKRLVRQGAVKVDGRVVRNVNEQCEFEQRLEVKVGRSCEKISKH